MTPRQCYWKTTERNHQAKLGSLFPQAHNESEENQPSDCGQKAFEKRYTSSSQPSKLSRKQSDHKRVTGHPSLQTHTKFKLYQNFEGNNPSPSATPDGLRTRTSHVSFPLHAFPGTACPGPCGSSMPPSPPPSLEGRGRLVSPDPYCPMTYSASLPTMSSHELLDDAEEPLSDRHVQTDQGTHFQCFDWDAGPKPKQLTEDPLLFFKRNKKSRHAAHTSLGRSAAQKLCVDAHCPMCPEKAIGPLSIKVCPTTLGPGLNPHGRRSLQPRFHRDLEPTVILN